jgi:hypothetical protein
MSTGDRLPARARAAPASQSVVAAPMPKMEPFMLASKEWPARTFPWTGGPAPAVHCSWTPLREQRHATRLRRVAPRRAWAAEERLAKRQAPGA